MSNKQRAGVYIRVSTEKQGDGVGLDTQEKVINEFLEKHKDEYSYDKSKHFFFDKESGAIENRKGLNQLFEAAKNKEIDVIVVYRSDRLYRKMSLLAKLIDDLAKWGVGFIGINDNLKLSGYEGKAQMLFFGVFAELERDLIRDRTMEAKRTKAALGYYVGGGIPPLGYDFYHDGKGILLKVNKDEKRLVNKIFRLYTRDRKTLGEIRKILEIDGEKTKDDRLAEKGKKTFKIKVGNWDRTVISRVLSSEVYTGKYYYGRYLHEKEKDTGRTIRKLNSPERILELSSPKILDEPEMFLEAKILLDLNKKIKNNKNTYPFTGLIKCGVCGKSYLGYKSVAKKGKKEYYRCKGSVRKSELIDRCHNFNVSGTILLDYVWKEIYKVFKDPEKYLKSLVKKEKKLNLAQQFEEELKNAEKNKEKLNTKLQHYLELLEESSEIKKNAYEKLVDKTVSEIEEINIFIENCKEKVKENKDFVENINNLDAIRKRYSEDIDNFSYERKIEIIRQYVEKIIVNYESGDFTVYFRFENNGGNENNGGDNGDGGEDNTPEDKDKGHISNISYKEQSAKNSTKKTKEKIDAVDSSTIYEKKKNTK